MPKYDLYQHLMDIGLVRVRRTDDDTVWWLGRQVAEAQIADGRAVLIPLSAEELQRRA